MNGRPRGARHGTLQLCLFTPQPRMPLKTDRRHRRLRRIVRPMTRFARAAGDRWDAITVRRRADRLLGSGGDWEIGAIQRARSGTRIARMRSRRDGREAILKIADAEAGVRGLKRERAVLSALCALPRLAALHPLLPEVLDAGSDGRWSYIVQRALPGAAAMPRLRRPGNRILSEASVIIAGLHEATSAPRAVADSDVEKWIERPIAVLRGLVIPRSGSAAARAIDRLGTEFRVAVKGATLPLGWIHGDLWPNNILVDTPTDIITGIVDWDSAEDARSGRSRSTASHPVHPKGPARDRDWDRDLQSPRTRSTLGRSRGVRPVRRNRRAARAQRGIAPSPRRPSLSASPH